MILLNAEEVASDLVFAWGVVVVGLVSAFFIFWPPEGLDTYIAGVLCLIGACYKLGRALKLLYAVRVEREKQ